jgi:hypothetical protein
MLFADVRRALELAQRFEAIATKISDFARTREASSLLGHTFHYMGDQAAAQRYIDVALIEISPTRNLLTTRADYSTRGQDLCLLARTLWLRGYADQAANIARRTIAEAETLGHPTVLCILLYYLTHLFRWVGDHVAAEASINKLLAQSEEYDLTIFHWLGLGFKGELSLLGGKADLGIPSLVRYLNDLEISEKNPQIPDLYPFLARGLLAVGSIDGSLKALERSIAQASESGNLLYMPELLRAKADILMSRQVPDHTEAEACLLRALDLAASQSALAWELRSATSLAVLRNKQGRRAAAKDTLAPVYDRFTEGFDTLDLLTAKALLEELA